MPRSVEKFGIGQSIKQLADLIHFSTGIKFDVKVEEQTDKLNPNVAMSIYRVIQEFVNN